MKVKATPELVEAEKQLEEAEATLRSLQQSLDDAERRLSDMATTSGKRRTQRIAEEAEVLRKTGVFAPGASLSVAEELRTLEAEVEVRRAAVEQQKKERQAAATRFSEAFKNAARLQFGSVASRIAKATAELLLANFEYRKFAEEFEQRAIGFPFPVPMFTLVGEARDPNASGNLHLKEMQEQKLVSGEEPYMVELARLQNPR